PDPGTAPPLAARASRVVPAVRVGTLAAVEIDLPDRPFGLPTGATVETRLETRRHEGWRVPLRALLENAGADWVFRVSDGGTVHPVRVEVRWRGDTFAVVRGDLEGVPRVVTAQESALLRLHDGEKVRVAEAAGADAPSGAAAPGPKADTGKARP
ncbi:hypothetical protein G3N55_09040, partial [Dissulfurirhabdus thermomarina]|nr:hypothetical protein [Dissulfurirhabdus thermomarina]